jgi:hypothetical protein
MHGEGLWAPVRDLYFSDIPFPGHTRCYNRRELVQILQWSGFLPSTVALFDLGDLGHKRSIGARLLYGVLYRFLLRPLFPDLRNYVWISARRMTGCSGQDH